MAESILWRAKRMVNAGVETAVGAAERLAGPVLMRQAVRDVDGAVEDMRKRAAAADQRRRRAAGQQRSAVEAGTKLREQARFALAAGRQDLAEEAVQQQVALEAQAAQARRDELDANEEAQRCAEAVVALTERKRRLEEELRAHEAASADGGPVPDKLERRVAAAEETFDRVRAATGAARPEVDAGVGARVAEIDALQREKAVADRLAALRAEVDGGVQPKRAGGKRG